MTRQIQKICVFLPKRATFRHFRRISLLFLGILGVLGLLATTVTFATEDTEPESSNSTGTAGNYQVTVTEDGSDTDTSVATLADPSTMDSWRSLFPGGESVSENIGQVWTDMSVLTEDTTLSSGKTVTLAKNDAERSDTAQSHLQESVSAGASTDDDSDFLVGLSAISSTLSVKTEGEYKYNDIVLILDLSGSMTNHMCGTSGSDRLSALKTAVRGFLAQVETVNQAILASHYGDNIELNRVAIVTFSSAPGAEQSKTEKVIGFTSDTATLDSKVTGLTNYGQTYPSYAFEIVADMLSGKDQADLPRSTAGKTVIFFTDGFPGTGVTVDKGEAVKTINLAGEIKKLGTAIYSIGIYEGANPNVLPDQNSSDSTDNANYFMQAVSSNFPNATATYDSDWHITLGDNGSIENGFYKTATTSDKLSQIFSEISAGFFSPAESPLEDNSFLTFSNQLGDYMEFDRWKLIVYGDGSADADWKYTSQSTNADDGSITYSYTFHDGEDDRNDEYDQKIVLKVTKSADLKTGDLVTVKIPASLVPTVNYTQTVNGETTTSVTVETPTPLQIFYGVSVKNQALTYLQTGAVQNYNSKLTAGDAGYDADLAEFSAFVSSSLDETGKVRFLANAFDGNIQTSATFTPATGNQFYYFTDKQATTLGLKVAKNSNPSNTADFSSSSTWSDTSTVTTLLGNNGRISVPQTVSNDPTVSTGDLTVGVTTSGDGADPEKPFTITITLADTSINGDYGGVTFQNGVASFPLKSGESRTITGLPTGTAFTVTETDNDSYTVTVTGEPESTIVADTTATVGFNNYLGLNDTDNNPNTDPDTDNADTEPDPDVDDPEASPDSSDGNDDSSQPDTVPAADNENTDENNTTPGDNTANADSGTAAPDTGAGSQNSASALPNLPFLEILLLGLGISCHSIYKHHKR